MMYVKLYDRFSSSSESIVSFGAVRAPVSRSDNPGNLFRPDSYQFRAFRFKRQNYTWMRGASLLPILERTHDCA